jgi:hypothetical protein
MPIEERQEGKTRFLDDEYRLVTLETIVFGRIGTERHRILLSK